MTRPRKLSSIRQSVTIPAQLAAELRRVAKEKHLTVGRALVVLAEHGLQAETNNRDSLNEAHRRFMSESDAEHRNEAGKDLVCAVFGSDAIAENPVL